MIGLLLCPKRVLFVCGENAIGVKRGEKGVVERGGERLGEGRMGKRKQRGEVKEMEKPMGQKNKKRKEKKSCDKF